MEQDADGPTTRTWLAGALATLLLVGAMRAFFSTVYFANLATLSINSSILWVLVAFAPLLLLAKPPLRETLLASVGALAAARIAMALAWGTRAAFLPLAAIAFAAGLVTLAALALHARALAGPARGAGALALGVGTGFALDAALTFLGHSVDLTVRAWPGLLLLVPVAAGLVVTVWRPAPGARAWGSAPGSPALAGAALGAILFLEHAAFASPHALARWNTLPVAPLAIGAIAGLLLPLWFAARGEGLDWRWLTLLNVGALVAVIDHTFLHSPLLPLWLVLAQAAIVLDLQLVLAPIGAGTMRSAGVALLVASLVTVLLHFVSAFAFTFAYVPLSALWEGAEKWLVPAAFLMVAWPAMALARRAGGEQVLPAPVPTLPPRTVALALALLVLLAALGVAMPSAPIADPPPAALPFRVMTFNLHQGFDNEGLVDADVFLDVLSAESPDIVALQESDTPRITSAGLDVAGVLADRLGYHLAYGQPTSAEAFGGALLSRFPIASVGSFPLPSDKDHRYFLEARLDVGGHDVWFYAVHLGLPARDREAQIKIVLARAAAHPAVILAGDLNSCPHVVCPDDEGDDADTVYDEVDARYADTFVVATGKNETDPAAFTYAATGLTHRIDYVFVSTDLRVLAARSVRTDAAIAASDHVPFVATLQIE